ncbi:hypothetical protein BJX99DRAFT_269858 [Aspergillus californicus]
MNAEDADNAPCRQPTWTSDPPERAKWEWGRVKRSFGSRVRRDAIDDLQRRNTALRNCFERQELSSVAAPTSTIDRLQSQFDVKVCNTIRDHAAAIHRALQRGWNCKCVLPHQATLDLQWHANRGAILSNQSFNLTLLYPPNSSCGGGSACSQQWRKTNMWVDEDQVVHASPLKIEESTLKPQAHDTTISKSSNTRLRFNLPIQQPSLSDSASSSKLPALNIATPTAPISSICKVIAENPGSAVLGFLSDTDASGKSRRVCLSSVQQTCNSPLELISLRTVLTSRRSTSQLKISRKQRLGIAAAMAWAVLHLGDTPWLIETWQGDAVQFVLDNGTSALDISSATPCICHEFHNTTPADIGKITDNTMHYKLVRNQTLFALGIFLIEVGFNRSFDELRKQALPDIQGPSVLEDYQLAIDLADELHLDASPEYGDAIKRCLRCEFPGRDVTKNFAHVQFRQEFFNGVVAPVQATFDCYSF